MRSDEEMRTIINGNPKYLWVPLEKASKSTRTTKAWMHPIEYAADFKRRIHNYCSDPQKYFREMYEGILSPEEKEQVDQDIRDM